MKPIDIFITAYLRPEYTLKTLEYLYSRSDYLYRVWLLDQGGNEWVGMRMKQDYANFHYINFGQNLGIHSAWNIALALAENEYFITSDNDILIPDLEPDWLSQLTKFMDERLDYGAISLHPHIFIGINGEDPNDPEDVKEAPMCGAVMRIMRTEAVRKVGGWEHIIEAGRNHEERTISSRLRDAGYKVGRTTRIRAWHEFGKNWGYPPEFTPEMQKHNGELDEYVNQFNDKSAYDEKTWLPRI
ncbi:MAG: glycosyltransferase family 2 protein [Rhabdochlamydiaceae bacterium]